MKPKTQKKVQILKHQSEFLQDFDTKELALVGGYGAGKTIALCYKALLLAIKNPSAAGAILEPTETMIGRTLLPTFEPILRESGIKFQIFKSVNKRIELYFPDGTRTIWLASAENYTRLVGMSLAWVGIDEIDVIDPDIALEAWRMAASRIRAGELRQQFCVSTPEGYKFLYNYFIKDLLLPENEHLTTKRRLIKASTYDNPFLPDDYISGILERYPAKQAEAYLNGEFVNFNTGTVYYAYDRQVNKTDFLLTTYADLMPIHIGLDFNVNNMAACVGVIDQKKAILIDEIVGEKNTESMIKEIKRRYGNGRVINVYPDSSGKNNSANADRSSIVLLEEAGFKVHYKSKNPAVTDRVNSVNAKIKNANGEIGVYINTNKCPHLVTGLEQQGYDKDGAPDKSSGIDHVLDAFGYFIYFHWPLVRKPSVTVRSR